MGVLEDFKVYCRDKCKYNVTDFNEIVSLFADFESERKARKKFYEDSGSSSPIEEPPEIDLSQEDSDGYFANLFKNVKH